MPIILNFFIVLNHSSWSQFFQPQYNYIDTCVSISHWFTWTSSLHFSINRSGISQTKNNIGVIIGGILGGLIFLGLLAALVRLFIRRRRTAARRMSFNDNNMVRSQKPENPGSRLTSFMGRRSFRLPTFFKDQMVMSQEPKNPSPTSPIDLRLSSLTFLPSMPPIPPRDGGTEGTREKPDDGVEKKSPGTQQSTLDGMQKQMGCLHSQTGSPWALTDIPPPGFTDYLAR